MGSKNFTDVLIGGKVYTLGGLEEESYLQQVASYINEKISVLRRQDGFAKQSEDYQTVMAYLNLADDYFKEREHAESLAGQKAGLEKENYSLKHELVSTQLKLEAALRETEGLKHALKEAETKLTQAEKKNRREAAAEGTKSGREERRPHTAGLALDVKVLTDQEEAALLKQIDDLKTELERYKALEAARAHMGQDGIPDGAAGQSYLGAVHKAEKEGRLLKETT